MESSYERAMEIMAMTPAVLRAVVSNLSEEAIDRKPAPETWSVHDILSHMLQGEVRSIRPRIKAMLAHEDPELPGSSPITLPDDIDSILDHWEHARARNLEFFRSIEPEQRDRTGRHIRFGSMTVREHVVEWAYHDLDHLRQIFAGLQAEVYPSISPFHSLYPSPV